MVWMNANDSDSWLTWSEVQVCHVPSAPSPHPHPASLPLFFCSISELIVELIVNLPAVFYFWIVSARTIVMLQIYQLSTEMCASPLMRVCAAAVREELCFPLAFPVQPKAPKEEEQEEKEEEGESLLHLQMKSEDENSQSGSAVSGSQKGSQKSNASKPALRHRILGESFLEARPPNGDLLYDKYLILSRDTKEPLMTVRRRGGVVSFLDVDTGDEIGSFHVLQDNLWRCSMFGESEDFRVETNELSTGICLSISRSNTRGHALEACIQDLDRWVALVARDTDMKMKFGFVTHSFIGYALMTLLHCTGSFRVFTGAYRF
jgi:hypothetical protein